MHVNVARPRLRLVAALTAVGLVSAVLAVTNAAPPAEKKNTAPPPRTRAEVEAVLGKPADARTGEPRPLEILLVAGKKDHGPGEHDYPAWQKKWEQLLAKSPGVKVTTAFDKVEPKQWDTADLAVVYLWGPNFWPQEEHLKGVDRLMARGGGLVVLHSAVIAGKDQNQQIADRLGIAYPQMIKFRHGPLALKTADLDHPVISKLGTVQLVDESYWPGVESSDMKRVKVLATTPEEGKERPMAWTFLPQVKMAPGGGEGRGPREARVFSTILGHYSWTFDDPLARVLILRGMAWAAGEPADRFNALATEGVKLREGGQ